MYARVVTAQTMPDQLDELIQLWHTVVAPTTRQQRGFRSARLLVDHTTGQVTSMGLWETEADLLASVAWNSDQLAKFVQLFTAPPSVAHHEVAGEV